MADEVMFRAQAQHILVSSREECEFLLGKLEAGAPFDVLAREYSECPTAEMGGLLGEFGPGQMPPEIDAVVFDGEIGPLYGPVRSGHGFHIVQVIELKELE